MIGLEPCDILFKRSPGIVGALIRFFTRRIGEGRTRINHVGLVIRNGERPLLIEALRRTVVRPVLETYRGETIAIYRPLELGDDQRAAILTMAMHYAGRSYGYLKILTHTLDWILQGAFVFRRLTQSQRYPICSWLVAESYAKAGLNFGVAPGAASPDDIWDYVIAHPQKYQCVLPLSKLEVANA